MKKFKKTKKMKNTTMCFSLPFIAKTVTPEFTENSGDMSKYRKAVQYRVVVSDIKFWIICSITSNQISSA